MPRKNRPIHERAATLPPRDPSGRNKRRSDVPGSALLTREPKLTPEYAREFVKLLHAGIPASQTLSYFAPEHFASLRPSKRREWLTRWQNSPLMAEAATAFTKGAWQDLDKDSRLQVAIDKHMAELAYFLYTTNYQRADGTDLKKLTDARTAIMAFMAEGDGDADTPMMRALKELLDGKIGDGKPPQLGETIPIEHTNVKERN